MASKYYKGYKFVTGGKSRPGIIGVKPKSGGVVDEFKARKLKQLGKTQKRLKSQDKQVGEAVKEAQKKGLSRKDAVKGRKFQRDNRRAQREGDKLRKDILRVGKKDGGMPETDKERQRRILESVKKKQKDKKPLGGKLKKPKPGSQSYQQQEIMKPPYKRKEMKKGGTIKRKYPDGGDIPRSLQRKPMDSGDEDSRRKLKPVQPDQKGLQKLPTKVRNKMGYMKKGGRVKKFPDLSGDGKVTKKDILMGRGVIKKKKFGGGKK
tara:strand:- start:39 stop:827 length:789 start_codon:yes stop_codon:yes gene_type:complete